MHHFSLCLLQQQQKGQGKKNKNKKACTWQVNLIFYLPGSALFLQVLFQLQKETLSWNREACSPPKGRARYRAPAARLRADLSLGKALSLRTFLRLSTLLSPCWDWTHFLLFSMPSPPWLLVVWWIKGHSCFNWLDFQLINSQIVFAALLALGSRYISYQKFPFLSASEIATQPEKLTPKRRATQKVLQNEQHRLAH